MRNVGALKSVGLGLRRPSATRVPGNFPQPPLLQELRAPNFSARPLNLFGAKPKKGDLMLGRKFLGLAAAVFAFALSSVAASASTVKYSTSGLFNYIGVGTGTSSLTQGDTTLTFTGFTGPVPDLSIGVNPAVFGFFKLTATDGVPDITAASFTLFVNQTIPDPASSSSLTAGITRYDLTFAGAGAGELVMSFSPTSVTLQGGITYAPSSFTQIVANAPGQTPLVGSITVPSGTPALTPLPMAAWGGIALFGLIGTARTRRFMALRA